MELGGSYREVKDAYKNVAKWAKTESVPMTLNWFAARPVIRKEPKGVVLIIRYVTGIDLCTQKGSF